MEVAVGKVERCAACRAPTARAVNVGQRLDAVAADLEYFRAKRLEPRTPRTRRDQ
jgi:hypothetical protein